MTLYIYRDWKGLNMTNSWWKDHDEAKMIDVETICPDLHFLDYSTDPTISNTYAQDAGIDGSRFEYNALQKTDVTLNFYLEFTDHEDFLDKKHDIQGYFASKAGFIIAAPQHPYIHMCGYPSKVDIKETSEHISVFSITLENALGMWYTNPTSYLEEHWGRDVMEDLRMPTNLTSPSWSLNSGHNSIWIAGQQMAQLTNPIMDCVISVSGASSDVKVINHTSNTSLEVKDCPSSEIHWNNLDLRDSDNNPINQYSNSTDFWLDPGWNDIELVGASSGYINTRFYFTSP